MNQKATKLCKACGKEIFFIKTDHFKSVPCDAEPVWIHQQSGGTPYIRIDGSTVVGYIAGDADDDPDSNLIPAYVSHFATCPAGDQFRKTRKKDRKARATRRTVW